MGREGRRDVNGDAEVTGGPAYARERGCKGLAVVCAGSLDEEVCEGTGKGARPGVGEVRVEQSKLVQPVDGGAVGAAGCICNGS